MRTTIIAILLAAVVFVSSCSSTSHMMISAPRPALAPQQVQVYFAPPPGRYQEIALLETGSGPLTYGEQNKTNSVIAKLRLEAARLGANGVLLQDTVNGYGGSNVGVGVGGGHFGGRSHIGGGIGVNISPSQKFARAVAIYVEGGAVSTRSLQPLPADNPPSN